ncbi:MAG: hypothetical protein RBR78_11395 [Flavobacteriaceae bacterium]|jgi:hypothetical protein|nr:hypothetical protein [Flavobacteriaceae bacterium]
MKFNDITFPHPVLGLGDAVSGSIELGNPEINSMQDVYEVKISCKHDNADLKNLLNEDKAEFLYEVTCTNTLYRKLFLCNKGKMEFEIPKKEVKGRVEFTCLLVAKERIPEYSNAEAHSDYDGYTFDLDQGEVLAYFGGFSFNADIKYEKLKAVSSFMEIVPNEELKYTYVDLKKNKIEIQLPMETYNLFQSDFISQEVKFAPVFHSSIVLNALLTALYNFDEHKDYLWAKVIDYRLKKEKQFELLDIAEKENIPEIAQRLLGNPFKRLLEGLNVIVEPESEE